MGKRLTRSCKVVDKPVQSMQKQQTGIHHLLPEILEHIFYFLGLRDLLTCRLVHPLWKKSATKPCRDKTKEIQFAYQNEAHRVLLVRHIMSLLVTSTDLQTFPTGKFRVKIGPLETFQFEKLSADEITHFFNTLASFVTEFTVVVSLGKTTHHSYTFLPKDLKFQRLKYLTLCVRNDDNYPRDDDDDDDKENEEKHSLLKFLRGVVENAESLKQISLKIGDQWGTPTRAIQMCVEECGIQSKMQLLTYLKIKGNVATVDWVALRNIGLKLQSLSILLEVKTTKQHDDTLKEFLQCQADTLTALQIVHHPLLVGHDDDDENYLNYELSKCSISFPKMTRLKSLEIISKVNEGYLTLLDWQIFQIPGFSYTAQFPALKQLNLKEAKVIWPCFLRDDVVPLDTLEELILSKYCDDDDSIIKAAAFIFPNIKKLHVAAKKNMLYAVFEGMTNLEELTLYTTLDNPIDDIISGVDRWEYPNVAGPKVAKVNAWRKLLRESTGKSMNCLENLKILRLHSSGSLYRYERKMLEFSDISSLVLREMKSLKCLDLGVRTLSFFPNELALLDELRKTLSVLLTEKERKLHRREFYKLKFQGGGLYEPANPGALESSKDSGSP